MIDRIDAIREEAIEKNVDSVLLQAQHHVRWASGFTGSNGLLLIKCREALFVTDGRYTEQAQDELRGFDIRISDDLVSL